MSRVIEHAKQRGIDFVRVIERDEDDTGIGDCRSDFRVGWGQRA
jgi:hypothetical protein